MDPNFQNTNQPPQSSYEINPQPLTPAPAPKSGGGVMKAIMFLVVGVLFAGGGYFLGSTTVAPKTIVKETKATTTQADASAMYKLATKSTTVSTAPATTIKMPDTWKIETKPNVPSVMASGPANHKESKLVPSVEASVTKSKNGTLAAEVVAFKTANAVDADMLISEKTLKINGQPATTIEFSMPDPDDTLSGKPVIMHMMVQFSVKDGNLYQVAMCGDDRDWFELIGMFQESLASFV